MNYTTKLAVKQSGLKIKYIAEKIGINPSQLSMAMSGYRFLPEGKEDELKAFLAKLPK